MTVTPTEMSQKISEYFQPVSASDAKKEHIRALLLDIVEYLAALDGGSTDPLIVALAALTTSANKGVYFSGADTPVTYDLTAFGRTLGGLADAAAGRTALELGTMATQNSAAVTITKMTQANYSTAVATADFASTGNESIYAGLLTAPAADSAAIKAAVYGEISHDSTFAITGSGHNIGVFGRADNVNSGNVVFAIGVEGRVDCSVGNITTAAALVATFGTNTDNAGSISIGVGLYIPDQADSGHIGSKFAILNQWAAAPIRTAGAVQAASYQNADGSKTFDLTRAFEKSLAIVSSNATLALTALPAAAAFLSGGQRHARIVDLSKCTQVRVTCYVATNMSQGSAVLDLMYKTGAFSSSASAYAAIGTSNVRIDLTSATQQDTGWIDLAAGAIADDIWIAPITSNGDGVGAGAIGNYIVQFR